MSNFEQFSRFWESLTDYLVSTMIKNEINNKVVSYDDVGKAYRNEILRWTKEGTHEGVWLENLKNANPEAASQFLQTLKNFQFDSAKSKRQSAGGVIKFFCAFVFGIAGGAAAVVSHMSPIIAGAAIGLLASLGAELGSMLINSRRKKLNNREIENCKEQLKKLGDKLGAFVQQAVPNNGTPTVGDA